MPITLLHNCFQTVRGLPVGLSRFFKRTGQLDNFNIQGDWEFNFSIIADTVKLFPLISFWVVF